MGKIWKVRGRPDYNRRELLTTKDCMDRDAGIAQLVEQRFCNPQAPCSIHGAGTIPHIVTS